MDNDNKLVQKAADLYRSLRFSMKYRGLTILSAEAGNDAIAAAIAAGADGLIIEVHNNPAKALCDGQQSLTPAQFDDLMKKAEQMTAMLGKQIVK